MVQLWGGHEPTIRRIGDGYIDQSELQGHYNRPNDLDMFADVGFTSLRYPVLWEKVSPDEGVFDWTWPDQQLNRLRELGINPIVGLQHHGSGPKYTNLLDSTYPTKLASYARAVAQRYPWVRDWTPVNEPLTTARFSCLYGLWYPHKKNDYDYWKALLNQLHGTILAMREIRRINPSARLIQTEDLGKVQSTDALVKQADYENNRRWMTWDILTGKYGPDHPLADELRSYGLHKEAHELSIVSRGVDVIGINYYLTSERFLDHRVQHYPGHYSTCGYVDIEAVRVSCADMGGIKAILREAAARYNTTIAITESHNGSYDVEERLRWIYEAWTSAVQLEEEGVDVEAVTCWALLGNYDWNSLLTNMVGHYESGPWDVRSGVPVETEMVPLLRYFAGQAADPHPYVQQDTGWWTKENRFFYHPQ